MQDGAADELHVEMAFAQGAARRFAHGGERVDQQIVQRLAVLMALREPAGALRQLRVRQCLHLRLEPVDPVDQGLNAVDVAFVGRAEEFLGEIAEHQGLS